MWYIFIKLLLNNFCWTWPISHKLEQLEEVMGASWPPYPISPTSTARRFLSLMVLVSLLTTTTYGYPLPFPFRSPSLKLALSNLPLINSHYSIVASFFFFPKFVFLISQKILLMVAQGGTTPNYISVNWRETIRRIVTPSSKI